MSKRTLDETIKHCLKVAEQNEISAITYKNCKEIKTNMYEKLTAEKAENECRERAEEHRQLAKWLTELKELRSIIDACNILAVDAFAVEKLCKELKEAKRLLQLAWDDIQTLNDATADDKGNCLIEDKFESCTECPLYCGSDEFCGWRYQVDALMLIGDEK